MLFNTRDVSQIKNKINQFGDNGTPFFFAVNYELTEGFLMDNPLENTDVYFMFRGHGNKSAVEFTNAGNTLKVFPVDYELYARKFERVAEALKAGEADVINLTLKTPVDPVMSLGEIFTRSSSPYQIYLPGRFVCFSPERFVRISDGVISANPMKGTIDASLPNAEAIIIEDKKEIAEHRATAELIATELRTVADNVEIKRFRYIDYIKSQNRNLLQVSSEIVADCLKTICHIWATLSSVCFLRDRLWGHPKRVL